MRLSSTNLLDLYILVMLELTSKLHPVVRMESMLPKGLPRSGTPPEELIMDIWFTIINCLRGQLDEVCNRSNDVVTALLCFWQKWQNTPMVTQGGYDLRWNYQPPR